MISTNRATDYKLCDNMFLEKKGQVNSISSSTKVPYTLKRTIPARFNN